MTHCIDPQKLIVVYGEVAELFHQLALNPIYVVDDITVTALIGYEKIAANMQLQLAEERRQASEQSLSLWLLPSRKQ